MRPGEGPKSRLTKRSVYPKRPPFRNPFPWPGPLTAQRAVCTVEGNGSLGVSGRAEGPAAVPVLNLTAVRATATIASASARTAQPRHAHGAAIPRKRAH